MKKYSLLLLTTFGCIILLTSSVPIGKTTIPEERIKSAIAALDAAKKDGKITNNELRTIAVELKGEKLTLKEKIGLKLFGKKISNKLIAQSGKFDGGGKSQLLALVLVMLFGSLGVHRFYLGYTWQGIVQLLTLGGCGIWALIDLIRIITGDLQPKDGEYSTTL